MKATDKGIKDANKMEDYLSEALSDFVEDFPKRDGLTRSVMEDDCVDDEFSFMYTDRAMNLIDRFKRRALKIASKYFPNEIFDISSPYIIEP